MYPFRLSTKVPILSNVWERLEISAFCEDTMVCKLSILWFIVPSSRVSWSAVTKPLLLVNSLVVVGTAMLTVSSAEASAENVPTVLPFRWMVRVASLAAAGIVGLFVNEL